MKYSYVKPPGLSCLQVSKVSDFGLSLALAEGQTHKSTRALGTVTHMAPEMLRTGRLAPPVSGALGSRPLYMLLGVSESA